MPLILNFHRDWMVMVRRDLAALGYSINPSTSDENAAIMFFGAIRRRLRQTKRTIKTSVEFSCLAALAPGLEILRRKIRKGEDLKPFLSRKLTDPDYDDPMLNDWGVYHLHVGTVLEGDGFMSRTDPVLFALITNTHVYEIQMYSHGQWANRDVLEIIHKNWPDLLEPYRLRGVTAIAHNPTSVELGKLRKANISCIHQVRDGTVYAPPGGGSMTDGTSGEVMARYVMMRRWLKNLEKTMHDNKATIEEGLKRQGYNESDDAEFLLEMAESGVRAVCPKFSYQAVLSRPG